MNAGSIKYRGQVVYMFAFDIAYEMGRGAGLELGGARGERRGGRCSAGRSTARVSRAESLDLWRGVTRCETSPLGLPQQAKMRSEKGVPAARW